MDVGLCKQFLPPNYERANFSINIKNPLDPQRVRLPQAWQQYQKPYLLIYQDHFQICGFQNVALQSLKTFHHGQNPSIDPDEYMQQVNQNHIQNPIHDLRDGALQLEYVVYAKR